MIFKAFNPSLTYEVLKFDDSEILQLIITINKAKFLLNRSVKYLGNILKLDRISGQFKEQQKHRLTVMNSDLAIFLVVFQDKEAFLPFFITALEECLPIGLTVQSVPTTLEEKQDLEAMHRHLCLVLQVSKDYSTLTFSISLYLYDYKLFWS